MLNFQTVFQGGWSFHIPTSNIVSSSCSTSSSTLGGVNLKKVIFTSIYLVGSQLQGEMGEGSGENETVSISSIYWFAPLKASVA